MDAVHGRRAVERRAAPEVDLAGLDRDRSVGRAPAMPAAAAFPDGEPPQGRLEPVGSTWQPCPAAEGPLAAPQAVPLMGGRLGLERCAVATVRLAAEEPAGRHASVPAPVSVGPEVSVSPAPPSPRIRETAPAGRSGSDPDAAPWESACLPRAGTSAQNRACVPSAPRERAEQDLPASAAWKGPAAERDLLDVPEPSKPGASKPAASKPAASKPGASKPGAPEREELTGVREEPPPARPAGPVRVPAGVPESAGVVVLQPPATESAAAASLPPKRPAKPSSLGLGCGLPALWSPGVILLQELPEQPVHPVARRLL